MLQNPGKLVMGPGTHPIDVGLFSLNRQRLVKRLRNLKEVPRRSVILLQGGKDVPFNDTDINYVFRQESYFMWTFGVAEPECYGAVSVETGETVLFIPRLPSSYAVVMGPIPKPEDAIAKYKVDKCYYVDEMAKVLKKVLDASTLLVLNGTNTDSGLSTLQVEFEGSREFVLDKKVLFNEIADLRVVKTDLEVEVIRYVVTVTSAAHRRVMRMTKPDVTEYQCESEFMHHCYSIGGCRNVSYTCISASGCNTGYLHYGHAGSPNDRTIKSGDLCLFDMGANYFGYCSDVTCTFPANGKFTPDQVVVYEAVLAANQAVAACIKPGVSWLDMHLLANRTLLDKLKRAGILVGDVDDMAQAGLGYVFQPHGLGHLMGLDVHDVGGYLAGNPQRANHPKGADKLRTARVLVEGMVLTNEPGCYFIDDLLDEASKDARLNKFVVWEVLDRFRGMGGVRIEDDVLVTADGCVNLTKVPRTVEEIEDWMAGKDDGKY